MKTFYEYVFGIMVGLTIGVCTTVGVLLHENGLPPLELSESEYSHAVSGHIELIQPLIPMQVKVTILPDEEFDNVRSGPKVAAFTRLGSKDRQCEIVMPVRTGSINYIPGDMYSAYFDRSGWGEKTLTHELLHCIKGWWHK